FTRALTREHGHDREELQRIKFPIGHPEIAGKEPAVITLSVAADSEERMTAEPRVGAESSGGAGGAVGEAGAGAGAGAEGAVRADGATGAEGAVRADGAAGAPQAE